MLSMKVRAKHYRKAQDENNLVSILEDTEGTITGVKADGLTVLWDYVLVSDAKVPDGEKPEFSVEREWPEEDVPFKSVTCLRVEGMKIHDQGRTRPLAQGQSA